VSFRVSTIRTFYCLFLTILFSLIFKNRVFAVIKAQNDVFTNTFDYYAGFSPHPEFFLPLGSSVEAVSGGVVTEVRFWKDHTDDYSVIVKPSKESNWSLN